MIALRNRLSAIVALAALVLFTLGAAPGWAEAASKINTLEKKGLFGYEDSGIAIRGYDTVAYFTLGKPTEGSDEYTTIWNEATWKFASQEHLDLFTANPEAYAPQYGGYCAYGIAAQDALVKIEGDQWEIVDGKLYLNYNSSVSRKWRKDIPGFILSADSKFEKLLNAE